MKRLWNRIKCLFGKHAFEIGISWAPDHICMIIGCRHCGKAVFHEHLGTGPKPPPPKHPAESRIH